jgi:hypothetical protein
MNAERGRRQVMSQKEWEAIIQLVGLGLVVGWLVLDGLGGGFAETSFAAVAMRLVWAIAAMVAFNIIAMIITMIGIGIVTRVEPRDEKPDERDVAIGAKALRNAGGVTASLAGLSLVVLAFGATPIFAVYALFAAPVLGGATDAVSRLVYYRIG